MIVHDNEYLDFSKIPESKGMPSFLALIAAIGLIGVFLVGGSCVALSGYGHHWPSLTTTRIPLGKNTQ